MKRYVIAMSGGIDSSITAYLIKQISLNIIGVYMNNWGESCNNNEDLISVKKIAKYLNIELIILDFSYEYYNLVFNKYIKNIKKGFTPNPDILCNKKIKFDLLYNYAKNILKANYFVTGHYAGIEKFKNNYFITKAKDTTKDQAYFLSQISKHVLKNCLFPLYLYKKKEIREIAKFYNFPNAEKKDSYGICFIANNKYKNFICNYIPNRRGWIINIFGDFLRAHEGIHYFTNNQRKGLRIAELKIKDNFKYYVNKKIIKYNLLIVDIKKKKIKYIIINNINMFIHFISNMYVTIQIKNIQKGEEANIKEIIFNKLYKIILKYEINSIASKQYISIFINNICLGSGQVIECF